MTFWEKLFLLFASLWGFMLAFMYYTWKLQKQQRTILRYIAARLTALESLLSHPLPDTTSSATPLPKTPSHKATPETVITIDKNEPISKYESVTLPDEININFVDR